MALDGTYGGLKASIASWLKRSDLTSSIPDLVALAEARIARDLRLRAQIVTATLTTVAGQRYVTLPSDWLETENLTLASTSPPASLSVVTPEVLDRKFPDGYVTRQPEVYTVVADRLLLGPTPDAAYTISLAYYARLDALSGDSDTNWLLAGHPGVYLFGSLAESAPFLMDDERVSLWEAKYKADVAALQLADDQSLRSGSAMRVRGL